MARVGDLSNLDVTWRSAFMLAACTPVALAAVMLALRRVERTANLWLAAMLLCVVISQVPQIIGFAGFYTVWPGLSFAPFNVSLFIGPMLYLHADRLMRGGPLGWRWALLIPGAAQCLYYLWAFTQLGDYTAKWAYAAQVHQPYIAPVETALAIGLLVFALFAIWRLSGRYRAYLENTQSDARRFDPVWLTRVIMAICVGGLIFVGAELAPILFGPVSFVDAFPAQLALTLIVAGFGVDALVRTAVDFPKMPGGVTQTAIDPAATDGPAKDWAAEGAALRRAVIDSRWYLEPRLSIRTLAARMGTNETYISRALNQGLGLSFNRFINGLRVEEAQRLLRDSARPMIDIAHAAGFGSKATFNRVFRDHTSTTPSQYRRRIPGRPSQNA